MLFARHDADGVAWLYLKMPTLQCHKTPTPSDVIELLGIPVPVQLCFAARHDRSLGEALIPVAMHRRMHQLTDFRAILSDVRHNAVVGLSHVSF